MWEDGEGLARLAEEGSTEKILFELRTKHSGKLAMWLPGKQCPGGTTVTPQALK